MNIKYHLAIGVAGEVIYPSKGMFLLFSVLPDAPLIMNEIKIIKQKIAYNENDVPELTVKFYHLFHSLFVTAVLFAINPVISMAHLIHIVSDWFTHIGRFASKPFYPLSDAQVKFGRNILK
jgi:hypothetical protein